MFIINDGTGNGNQAKVTSENAVKIVGETHHIQHHFSRVDGQVYQALSVVSLSASGSQSMLHIKNDSSDLVMGITYIRLQVVDFVGLPSSNEYFSIGGNSVYDSNGTSITPVNINFGSGNVANATIYKEAITTGGIDEFDRWYIQANGNEERYEKWGSILLFQNDTIEIVLNTLNSSGTVKTRVTFCMFDMEI